MPKVYHIRRRECKISARLPELPGIIWVQIVPKRAMQRIFVLLLALSLSAAAGEAAAKDRTACGRRPDSPRQAARPGRRIAGGRRRPHGPRQHGPSGAGNRRGRPECTGRTGNPVARDHSCRSANRPAPACIRARRYTGTSTATRSGRSACGATGCTGRAQAKGRPVRPFARRQPDRALRAEGAAGRAGRRGRPWRPRPGAPSAPTLPTGRATSATGWPT